jgi:hypothetical protein
LAPQCLNNHSFGTSVSVTAMNKHARRLGDGYKMFVLIQNVHLLPPADKTVTHVGGDRSHWRTEFTRSFEPN